MKVRFDINGLDCPHCALKLQELMKKVEGVEDAVINFAFKSLIVEVPEDIDEDALLQRLQQTADDFEGGISIDFKD